MRGGSPYVDHLAARLREQWQQGLCEREGTHDVDIELATQFRRWHRLDRSLHDDAGHVDQPRESTAGDYPRDFVTDRGDCLGAFHVQSDADDTAGSGCY